MAAERNMPPLDPDTSEATRKQLDLAVAQGEAYGRALEHMAHDVADAGGQQRAGEYLVGYAVEEAEGLYRLEDGDLVWHNPGAENAHLEITVRDAADGRFIPGLDVRAALITPGGRELGPWPQDLVWHPMIYHYARNWELPEDGDYTLRVHVDPPRFMRHDEVNGRRFVEPVDVEFTGVHIERSTERVEPPGQ